MVNHTIKCVFCKTALDNPIEKGMTLYEQMETDFTKVGKLIYTNSPAIVAQFKKYQVMIAEDFNSEPKYPTIETYGTSLDILYKYLFGAKQLLPRNVVDDIKQHLPKNTADKQECLESTDWINHNLGESIEKSYLIRKLSID